MSAKSRGIIERSLSSFVVALQHTFDAEEIAKKNGLLQRLDPRVKIVAFLPLIVIAALTRRLRIVFMLFAIAVAIAAATFSVVFILCTPWSHVLKALRVLRLPTVLVVILGMTYRYIFLLLRTAHDMFESRKSRMVGQLDGRELRKMATASAGVLMSKTLRLSGDVYLAMRSRGFQGEVYVLDEFQTSWLDWVMLTLLSAIALLAFWFGR